MSHNVAAVAAVLSDEGLGNVCGMETVIEATVEAGKQGADVGFWKGLLFQGLMFASEHPVYTGLIGGVVGMLAVFALRRALWSSLKYVVGIPMAALRATAKPMIWAYRKVRRQPMGARVTRLPMLGEVAYVGPCRTNCGTKYERRVRVTAFSGGALRGIDTVTGAQVLGCADCSRV